MAMGRLPDQRVQRQTMPSTNSTRRAIALAAAVLVVSLARPMLAGCCYYTNPETGAVVTEGVDGPVDGPECACVAGEDGEESSRPTAPLAGGSTSGGGASLAARIFAWDDRHHPRAEHLAALQCAVADTTGLVVRGVLEVHGGGSASSRSRRTRRWRRRAPSKAPSAPSWTSARAQCFILVSLR